MVGFDIYNTKACDVPTTTHRPRPARPRHSAPRPRHTIAGVRRELVRRKCVDIRMSHRLVVLMAMTRPPLVVAIGDAPKARAVDPLTYCRGVWCNDCRRRQSYHAVSRPPPVEECLRRCRRGAK